MSFIADFFIVLWLEASQWPQHELENLTAGNQALLGQIESNLKGRPDESTCLSLIKGMIEASKGQGGVRASKINGMLAIDRVFQAIHPRASAGVNDQNISPWLKEYRIKRIASDAYAETDTHRLIPNGPLRSSVHPEGSNGAFLFADHFFSLRVVPKTYTSEDRAKSVQVQVISPSKQLSKPNGDTKDHALAGHEKVLCMAVADDVCDLDIKIKDDLVHVTPNLTAYDPAGRWIQGLNQHDSIDLALGSEFAMTAASMSQLKKSLYARAGIPPPLIVAGSFHQPDQPDQLPLNRVEVINGLGQPLWTQNKNWPAQMNTTLLEGLGVSLPPDKPPLCSEANQAGDGWVVADLDQLGRFLILICQDLKCAASHQLIRDHQPDWVLCPILDKGVDPPGRWMHQEVFHLSRLSQARFVVVSGLSLSKRLYPDKQTSFVMAHGPFEPRHQNAINRAVAFLSSQHEISPQRVLLRWSQIEWQQSSLTTTDHS